VREADLSVTESGVSGNHVRTYFRTCCEYWKSLRAQCSSPRWQKPATGLRPKVL